MAVGDMYWQLASVANDGYLTIQPSSGDEVVITYITVNGGGKVKISHYDGTYEAIIVDLSAAGGDAIPFSGQGFPINNSCYLRVQNKNGADLILGCVGYYTKVAS